MQYHAIPCNTMQYHAKPCHTMQYHAISCNTMQYHAIQCNTMQYHAIPCNTMQYHAIPCNTMQYNAIPCNTMQYHASLITADGAYHCPVGSIMAIFILINYRAAPMVSSSQLSCCNGVLSQLYVLDFARFLVAPSRPCINLV